MEFSEIFSFFAILKESINLLPKIWKITTPVAAISLILPSLFFFLFATSINVIRTPNAAFIRLLIICASEILLLFVYISLSHLSGISTVLASTAAYSGKRFSPSDLLSTVKKTWKRPLKLSLRMSVKSTIGIVLLGCSIAAVIIMDLINPITVSLLVVLSIALVIFHLKSAAGRVLAMVASIVEENSEGIKAVERGEKLVEGQRLKGFMMNLFINVLACACFLVFWIMVGDKGSLNIMIYGLFFVNFMALFKIYLYVVYTVFYFQCRKHHGEEIDGVGEVLYAKLPASA